MSDRPESRLSQLLNDFEEALIAVLLGLSLIHI